MVGLTRLASCWIPEVFHVRFFGSPRDVLRAAPANSVREAQVELSSRFE